MSVSAATKFYSEAPGGLIRIVEGGKVPLDKGWNKKEVSRSALVAHKKSGGNVGWAMGEGWLVVDVDVKGGGVGADSFARLVSDWGALEVTVRTPSGGWHCYVRVPLGVKFKRSLKDYPNIDFLGVGAYVLASGSVLGGDGDGGRYVAEVEAFERLADVDELAPGLLDLLSGSGGGGVGLLDDEDGLLGAVLGAGGGSSFEPVTVERMRGLLAVLDPGMGRDEWMNVLMAVNAWARSDLGEVEGGLKIGWEVASAWSSGWPEYDERRVRHEWDSIEGRVGGVGVGTLVNLADSAARELISRELGGVRGVKEVEALEGRVCGWEVMKVGTKADLVGDFKGAYKELGESRGVGSIRQSLGLDDSGKTDMEVEGGGDSASAARLVIELKKRCVLYDDGGRGKWLVFSGDGSTARAISLGGLDMIYGGLVLRGKNGKRVTPTAYIKQNCEGFHISGETFGVECTGSVLKVAHGGGGIGRVLDSCNFGDWGGGFLDVEGLDDCSVGYHLNTYKPPKIMPVGDSDGDGVGWGSDGLGAVAMLRLHMGLLCNFDDELVAVLVEWLAHLVQFPGRKILWMPILVTKEGVGKEYIPRLLMRLVGYVVEVSADLLGSKFNGYAEGKLVGVLQEMRVSEKTKDDTANKIKTLIANEHLDITIKGSSEKRIKNTMNLIGFTNYSSPFNFKDTRRFFVITTAATFVGGEFEPRLLGRLGCGVAIYYERLFSALKDDRVVGALSDYLKGVPIRDGFATMRAPQTEYMAVQQADQDELLMGLMEAREILEAGAWWYQGGFIIDIELKEAVNDRLVFDVGGAKMKAWQYKQLREALGAVRVVVGTDDNLIKMNKKKVSIFYIGDDLEKYGKNKIKLRNKIRALF